MSTENIKDWTILIYANGNNDMEPEIYNSLLEAEKIGSTDTVNVIMQLSRLNQNLVKTLRPINPLPYAKESWNGVRRYFIKHKHSILLEDIGLTNMAHPESLSEFIQWGMNYYPAEHYMLLISGHGMSFIGGLPDLSIDLPYLMGFAEMAQAINHTKKLTGNNIDILILDMCYMNSLEIIYEFGYQEENAVKTVLTYIDNGPLSGLSLSRLIAAAHQYGQVNNLYSFLKLIIPELPAELIAYDISPQKLRIIKDAFNQLAYNYLLTRQKNPENPLDSIRKLTPGSPWISYIEGISKKLQDIIICRSKNFSKNTKVINLIAENLGELIPLYCKLAFAKENHWTSLLSNTPIKEYSNIEIKPKPMVLSRSGLAGILLQLNPALNVRNLDSLFQRS